MGPGRSQSAVIPLSPHPSQAKTPWGASNGPLDHERPNPLGFNQGRHPGSQIWIRRGPDWPLARPLPQGAEPPGPWGGAIEPMGTRPMAPPSKLPPLTAGRQGWSAAASDGQAVPSLAAAGVGRCPVVLLPRAGRRRPGQGRPEGLDPSSTGGQGQGKVGLTGSGQQPQSIKRTPLGP